MMAYAHQQTYLPPAKLIPQPPVNFIAQSPHYVWWTNHVLGKGATSTVYQGRNKSTKEKVAVKVFLPNTEIRKDEFEILRNMQHRNIVKFKRIEQSNTGGEIMVMELCLGGSLYTVVQDPISAYGLEEDELLRALSDITQGMDYLRKNNVVHRDIKPGNIMRVPGEDGLFIYKLTDFGAAKVLKEPNEEFMSLYGTEEYLHPDMYERAFLSQTQKGRLKEHFGAEVDLWSIGVTVYQLATGQLPFQPYGGRNDKGMMHKLTTEKGPRDISGRQQSLTGTIVFSEHLPPNLKLSADLREILENILRGILQSSPAKSWNFSQLFEAVQNLQKKVVIHVFVLHSAEMDCLYCDAQTDDLIHRIRERYHISSEREISLIFNNTLFQCPSQGHLETMPETSMENPIIVLVNSSIPTVLNEFQTCDEDPFTRPQCVQLHKEDYAVDARQPFDNQFITIREMVAEIYFIKSKVEEIFSKEKHIETSINALIQITCDELREPKLRLSQMLEHCKSTDSVLALFHENNALYSQLIDASCHTLEQDTEGDVGSYIAFNRTSKARLPGQQAITAISVLTQELHTEFQNFKNQLSSLNKEMETIYRENVMESYLANQWRAQLDDVSLTTGRMTFRDVETMRSFAKEARKIFKYCSEVKSKKIYHNLSEADLQELYYLVKDLESLFSRSKTLLRTRCESSLISLHNHAGTSFLAILPVNKKTDELQGTALVLEKKLKDNREKLENSLMPEIRRSIEKYAQERKETVSQSTTKSKLSLSSNKDAIEKEVQRRVKKEMKGFYKDLAELKAYLRSNEELYNRLEDLNVSGGGESGRGGFVIGPQI